MLSSGSGLACEFAAWCTANHNWGTQATDDLVMARTLVDVHLLPLLAKWLGRDVVSQLDTALHAHYPPEQWCILWSAGCVSGKPPLRFLFGWKADGSGELRGHWRPLLEALPACSDVARSVQHMEPVTDDGLRNTSRWPKDTQPAPPAGEPAISSADVSASVVPVADVVPADAGTENPAATVANDVAGETRLTMQNKLGDLTGPHIYIYKHKCTHIYIQIYIYLYIYTCV